MAAHGRSKTSTPRTDPFDLPHTSAVKRGTSKGWQKQRKTKFCMYFLQGVCKYTGDGCAFAHNTAEIKAARKKGQRVEEEPEAAGPEHKEKTKADANGCTRRIEQLLQTPKPRYASLPVAAGGGDNSAVSPPFGTNLSATSRSRLSTSTRASTVSTLTQIGSEGQGFASSPPWQSDSTGASDPSNLAECASPSAGAAVAATLSPLAPGAAPAAQPRSRQSASTGALTASMLAQLASRAPPSAPPRSRQPASTEALAASMLARLMSEAQPSVPSRSPLSASTGAVNASILAQLASRAQAAAPPRSRQQASTGAPRASLLAQLASNAEPPAPMHFSAAPAPESAANEIGHPSLGDPWFVHSRLCQTAPPQGLNDPVRLSSELLHSRVPWPDAKQLYEAECARLREVPSQLARSDLVDAAVLDQHIAAAKSICMEAVAGLTILRDNLLRQTVLGQGHDAHAMHGFQ